MLGALEFVENPSDMNNIDEKFALIKPNTQTANCSLPYGLWFQLKIGIRAIQIGFGADASVMKLRILNGTTWSGPTGVNLT